MPREFTIVHMGDSITYGQCVDAALRWTTLVAERLERDLTGSEICIRSENRGISGNTTRQGLERFPTDVQQLHPDIVTLQFGLNDCNCWETDLGLPRVSEAAFESNLIEMITRAKRFGAKQLILATNHRTMKRSVLPSGEVYECANERYSRIVRHVAEQTGVTLCDVRAAFEGLSDGELESMLVPAPDLLHLSVRGNCVYADVIYPFVLRAVEAVAALQPITLGCNHNEK